MSKSLVAFVHKILKPTFILLSFSIVGAGITSCAPRKQKDCGFVQNVYGQRISWKNKLPVELYIDTSVPQDLRSAIKRAADTWQAQLGTQAFILKEDMSGVEGVPRRDRKNGIYFLKEWESDRKSEQGRTNVYWAGDEIQEADIRVNAAGFRYYNQDHSQMFGGVQLKSSVQEGYSFEALILHEMGHFLGLKHSDKPESVMVTKLSAFSDRTQLSEFDALDVQCEYN